MTGRSLDDGIDFDYVEKYQSFIEYDDLIKSIDENNLDNFISLMLTNDFEFKKLFSHLIVEENKQEYFKACLAVIVSKFKDNCKDFVICELQKNKKMYLIEHLLNGELDKIIINSKSKHKGKYHPTRELRKWGEVIIKTNDSNFIKKSISYFINRDSYFFLRNLILYTNDVDLLEHLLNSYYKMHNKERNVNDLNDYFKYAIIVGNKPYFEYFIKLGCKLKETDYFSQMENFDKDTIKYLLDNGASIYINNGSKRVPDKVLTNIIKCLL